MALKFYTNPMSRGQTVRWMLEEVGEPYETEILDYGTTMKAEPYLSVNPMGKVPAIVHDGKVVTECAAICAYLADAFPSAMLGPSHDERADYYRWFFFAAGPLEQAVSSNYCGFKPSAEQERMVGFGNFERVIGVLDDLFANRRFVCGNRFTAADVYVGSQVDWGLQFGTIPERDNLKAYAERLRERDGYARAKQIDSKLIEAMKAAMPAAG